MNFTGVEGENITFGPGDMVLTPHDTWHNHGNQGDDPAINLSVLDLPLCETLNATYFEHDYSEDEKGERVRKAVQSERFPPDYSQRVYGAGGLLPRFLSHKRGTGNASPMYVYRWSAMRETLDKFRDWPGDPHEALLIEYVDPTTGGPVYKTITFFAQMLRPGERTLPLKQNASLLVRAVRGPRPQHRRRRPPRLGAVRHLRRARRQLVRARQRVRQDRPPSSSSPATSPR